MQQITDKKHRIIEPFTTVTTFSKYLAMVLFIIFPFVGFYLGMQYQKIMGNNEMNQVIITTPAPKIESEVNEPLNVEPTVYKLNVDLGSRSYLEGTDIFDLVSGSSDYWRDEYRKGYPGLYFDVTEGRSVGDLVGGPIEGVDFYLFSDWKLEVGKTYSNEALSVVVISEEEGLVPYLEDNDYCEQNSDCSIRYDWCVKGGWNNYSYYQEGIGCQFGNNEGQPEGVEVELECEEHPASTGIIAQYDSVSCVNNSCVGGNPTFACEESTLGWIEDGGGL